MRRWNDDPFTKKARRENYAARSVYKLREIHQRDQILAEAKTILDLGAAPGSWSQFCLEALPSVTVFAIDHSALQIRNDRLKFLQIDIRLAVISNFIAPHQTVDVILSDMAPKTTGIRVVDVEASTELARLAIHISDQILRPGGNMVVKLFMGDTLNEIEREFRSRFRNARLLRPGATRKHSMEIFIVGKQKLS